MNVLRMDLNKRIWIARGLAVLADGIQIGLAPLMSPGVLSPFNVALDLVMAGVLTKLVGWHIAFLPGFIIEQIPVVNLAPTWTLAIMIATRGRLPSAKQTP